MTDVQAARRRLEAAGVRYVFGAYTDLNGVPKSKCVPIDGGLAGKDGGQIGAGILKAPLESFIAAAAALRDAG
jgi:hypothetical protein